MSLSLITRDAIDDDGNILSGAAVTIRVGHAPGGSLATLYSDQAGTTAISNPITADGSGSGSSQAGQISCYVQPGRYRLEGTSAAGSGVDLIDTGPISGKTYATLAAFSADVTAGYTADDGTIISAGPVEFQADSSAAITGLPAGWKPYGPITPNHWKDNDGAIDTIMTEAIQSAIDYGDTIDVEFLAERYMIDDTIKVVGRNDDMALEPVRLVGKGFKTEIRLTDPTKDHFRIIKNEATVFGWLTGEFSGFQLISVNVTKAQKGAAIRHSRCFEVEFKDLFIHGPTNIIISENSAQCRYSQIISRGTFRAVGETMDSVYTFTDNVGTTTAMPEGTGRSFGNYMSNCEHHAGEMCDQVFDIRGIDGLYITNCHFNTCTKRIHIRPNNTEWQTHIYQFMCSNTYWDGDGPPVDTVVISATNPDGLTPAIRIEGLYFSNCHFRRGEEGSMFRFGQNASDIAGLLTCRDIIFDGCHIKDHTGRIFDLTHPDMTSPEDIIDTFEVNGGIIMDGPPSAGRVEAPSAFRLAGKNTKVQGVTVQGGWDNDGEAVVVIEADSENAMVTGNLFDVARDTSVISVNQNAVNPTVYGNAISSLPRIYDINQTIIVGNTSEPGLIIRPRIASADSDIVLRSNGVIASESSLSVAVETGGSINFITGITDAESGTGGGTTVASVDSAGLKMGGNLVVERGSNANGSWVKFGDGTMRCRHELTVNYLSAGVCASTWTFPAAFDAAPIATATLNEVGDATPVENHIGAMRVQSVSTTSAEVRVPRVTGQTNFAPGDFVTAYVMAEGTWS